MKNLFGLSLIQAFGQQRQGGSGGIGLLGLELFQEFASQRL